jgi:uncharacterized cupin superfamily protein
MERVSIDDVEPSAFGSDVDRRGLSDPLGTTDLAINRYRLGPGERFSGGLHAHMDQEEVFVVVAGEATFETRNGTVTVGEDEAIRFAPGEFQTGMNRADEPLVAFALGAPRDTEDVRVLQACPDCDHENMRAVPSDDGDGFDLVCPECDATAE